MSSSVPLMFSSKSFIVSDLTFSSLIRFDFVEETQAEIKIARRNINNLRYADDTTLMAESEEN